MFVSLICYLERQRVDGGLLTPPCPTGVYKDSPQRSCTHSPPASGATTRHLRRPPSFSTLQRKQLTGCRCPTDRWELMDIPCAITLQPRCTRSTKAASARRPRSPPAESPSLLTLCSPSRRTPAAAGRVPLRAETSTTRQPHFCLCPDRQAYR